MTIKNSPAKEPAKRVLDITRVFDATRDLVFKQWVLPDHIARWSCLKGFTTILSGGEIHPGGPCRTLP